MANILIEQDTMNNIANAIRAKNGLSTTYTPAQMVNAINDLSTSGSGSESGSISDVVRFIDYDGTILHSYSASEFANLTEMPANPTHTGLTSQGWNWSLADAKTYVANYGMLDIGQMYITNDGKTRIYISLVDSARLSPYLGICPNGTVVVDWGDNTATDTLTGISLTTVKRAQHTYASTGDYVITLTVSSGTFAIYSSASSNGSTLLTRTDGDSSSQKVYQNAIQKIEIGSSAFINRLAFYNCYSLASITIPSGDTSIDDQAFQNCYSLTSITIPSTVTSIEDSAFDNCYSLVSITIPSTVISIGNTFQNCHSLTSIAIPSGVTSITGGIFSNCDSLASITIPNGVTSIGNSAFSRCYSLASITIPSGVTNIDSYAFSNCYSLQNITIPNGVTSIGNNAFQTCFSLTSITISSGVTSIGDTAFSSCYSLTSITIPSTVISIGNGAFSNCQSLASITIPSGVTNIGINAFSSCYSLASITIPNGVTSIGNSTFSSCYSLASITIPSGITSIGANAFSGCYSLSSITIPSDVTSIGTQAFQNCYGVAEYHFLPTTPPTLATTAAFTGILADCKIYVPSASLTAYQTASNWSTYASYMIGE